MTPTQIYNRAWASGFRPELVMSLSAWSDKHRVLSTKGSAEPGRWRTDRTPYLRAIMDDLSPSSPVEKVVFMKGAQLGATEIGNNFIAFAIAETPGPIMMVLPTVEMAKRSSRQRIDPMLAETPRLADLVAPARSRDSGNTIQSKDFPGGTLIMVGANSPVGLRSMPVRFLFCDEIDGYPLDAGEEGDPVELAIKRTDTFTVRRKIFLVSTPTVEGVSRIEQEYLATDQRRYFVPCPHCGHHQILIWERVRWSDLGLDPWDAVYLCEACEAPIEHREKAGMLAGGRWEATGEPTPGPMVRGYHLSGLCSPWKSWGALAVDFCAARGSDSRHKVWTNTALGKSWTESGEAPDWRRLYDRRESYPIGELPAGALYITAGVDVQRDRLEVLLLAWGRNREAWALDRFVFYGDPEQPAAWAELDKLLNRQWDHPAGGLLSIGRLAVDSGNWSSAVYRWAARHPASRVMAIKGTDRTSTTLGAPSYVEVKRGGRKFKRGVQLWPVGVSILKRELYSLLALDPPTDPGDPFPEGYRHFPAAAAFDEEFFRQLTAEKLVKRANRSGFVRLEWQKTRERNEALDVTVYATAAALAARLDRWSEADFEVAEQMAGLVRVPDPERQAEPERRAADRPPTRVVKSRWLGN